MRSKDKMVFFLNHIKIKGKKIAANEIFAKTYHSMYLLFEAVEAN